MRVRLRQDGPIPLAVSLDCRPGEILVIVGPSGSGKSTTLRAVSGLYTPRQGQIRSNGVTWLDTERRVNLPPQQRKIGMVFQHYALFPHLSARQNILIALNGRDASDKRQRARDLLALINMRGLEDRLPTQLSGGQQQRIALARALARDPEVLLLDEPFSAVDQQTRRKLVRELLLLRKQIRMPIMHVTHDLNEARRIADRLCILHRGETLQLDTPEQIMSHPLNSKVAGLIGHDNIFRATVTAHDQERQITRLQWQGGRLEAAYQPRFPIGATCRWMIPAENVILHRQDKPSRGERENPLRGKISECVKTGASTSIKMTLESGQALYLNLPTHAATRNRLSEGGAITVSLLARAIHLMTE